jgi:Zn-dependent M28 family amino/carboxypeptidase
MVRATLQPKAYPRMKPILVSAVALTAALLVAGCKPHEATAPKSPIDPARLSQHIKVLSSDDFQGRGPATEGETKAISYIADQMKAEGLEPAGDKGTWFQDVPLARFQVKNVRMSLTAGGKTEALTQGEQAVVQSKLPRDHLDVKNAPLVFVGYGVKAPERNWDDFKGVDLHGKIMVVLVNDPDFENPKSTLFGGPAMTYYGRWTYKYQEAARQGAIGTLIVHETKPASYGWNTVKNSNANAQFDIVRDDPAKEHAPFAGWIQRDVAVDLFKKSGLDFEQLKEKAKQADFHPVELKGASFSVAFDVDHSQIVSHNVAGMIKGAKRPNETLIYSAHWDHLGIGKPDARGDTIYNGAVDNATGIADLLELARVFKAGKQPDRSILFLAVTAEEKGLLGSTYYASNPLRPVASTVADINMDALSVAGPAKDITVSGSRQNDLEDSLKALAKSEGRYLSPDPEPGAGSYYRSDHFPFAQVGVPSVSFGSGEDLVKGGRKAGRAVSDHYTECCYHQPADEWHADWDLTGQAQDVGLLYRLGQDLANSDKWPKWYPDSEFRAERDKTAADRK